MTDLGALRLFAVIVLLTLTIPALNAVAGSVRAQSWTATPASVIRVDDTPGGGCLTEYAYTVGDRTYTSTRLSFVTGPAVPCAAQVGPALGESVTAFVNPRRPGEATLNRNAPASAWRHLQVVGAAVTLLLLIPRTVWAAMKRRAARINLDEGTDEPSHPAVDPPTVRSARSSGSPVPAARGLARRPHPPQGSRTGPDPA